MINKKTVLIGSDIEVFLKSKTSGKFISAVGLIGGSKENPRPLDKEGCCVQEDNVALEYNVPPVKLTEHALMSKNIAYVLETVRKDLSEDLEIVCCPSATFYPDQLNTSQAQEFGCEPDFNAWLDCMPNDRPYADDVMLRSCGGHIHVSYEDHNVTTSIDLVKVFDLFLGVPSVLIDTDKNRRKLYGKAGSFRFKTWGNDGGFEYRTLSNWWTEKPEYVKYIFSQIDKAFDFLNNNTVGVEIYAEEIQQAINESNTSLAYALCLQFGLIIPEFEKVKV